MAGTWSETNKQTLPGFYNRFQTIAQKRIEAGTQGIMAMPIKANWGPVKEIVSIADENNLINTFGSDLNYTAYKLGRLALFGQPKELLLYRLADGSESVATLTLKNSESTPADVIKLDTKYPTTREFNVTIRTNISDSSKKDLLLFEGTRQLIAISELSGTIDQIIDSINSNTDNSYITASKVGNATGTLAAISNAKLTGGNNGVAEITNEDYINAMAVIEKYKIDGFALDGITDGSLQTSVKTWTAANKESGNNFISFVGGSNDTTIEQANTKSKELNHENVVNVGVPAYYQGVEYTPAEVAVYIAALAMGQSLRESICNKSTIFNKVGLKLSKKEKEIALKSGTLILSEEDKTVTVVDDKNTFTEYTDEKSDTLGYIRAVKFISTVDEDTTVTGNTFVGKVLNDNTGRLSIISALKKYFETLVSAGVIASDFTVEIDKGLQANAKNDEFFWKWSATYVNVMKKIYGSGYIS